MKCNRCGREINDNESYCIYCGNHINMNYKKKFNKDKKKAIIKKKEIKTNDDEIEDTTLFVAGKVFLFLIPLIIFGIVMMKHYLKEAQHPQTEFFGPLPELMMVGCFGFLVLILLLIPLAIIVNGAFTGKYRKHKNEKEENKKTE